jgi:hypothetical protein
VRRLILCASLAIAAGCGPHQLATGDLTLRGVTSDGFAIVADAAGQLHALSLDDGHAQAIAEERDGLVQIFGTLVTVWDQLQLEAMWSGATGLLAPPMNGNMPILRSNFGATDDGSAFAFVATYGLDAPTLMVEGIGGQPVPVSDHVYDWTFVGDQLLFTIPGQPTTLVAFNPAIGERKQLLDNAECPISPGPAGTSILTCAGGETVLISLDGSPPRTIASIMPEAKIAHDGSVVFYPNASGALMRSTSSGEEQLQPPDSVRSILAASPDDREVLLSGSDYLVSVVSAVKDATPLAISNGISLGDSPPFTTDGRFVLVPGKNDPSGFFDLASFSTVNGTQTPFAKGVARVVLVNGSRVLVNDHRVPDKTAGDLELFDLASGSTTSIATGANPDFFLAPDGKSVLFTIPGQALFQQSL